MKINRVCFLILLLNLSCILFSGCASMGQKWRELVGGGDETTPSTAKDAGSRSDTNIKYSDQQDVPVQENRRYRRMTREQFEKEGLTDDTGSLWSGDGQSPYLFSANMVRIPGDSVNIALDGEPKKQLSQKANVLAQLMKKVSRQPAAAQPPSPPPASAAAPGQTPAPAGAAAATPPPVAEKKEEKEEDGKDSFSVSSIPARIVERVPDGSYRVRGTQTFMIGKDEYRVIATGLVKSTDISDEGVPSSKMMDPKFDIVSMKKDKEKELK